VLRWSRRCASPCAARMMRRRSSKLIVSESIVLNDDGSEAAE
jgi:hypothetical protein